MVRRVIAESGSPSFSNGVGLSPQVGAYIAKKLGCTDIDGMRSIPSEILGELSESLSMKVWPIRNGKTVPKDPYEELGKRRIDILAGSNLNEMETFASSMGKDMLVDTTRRTVSSLPEKEKMIATEFLGSGDDLSKYMILANGSLFSAPAEMLALQATRSGGKGYRYVWTAETGRPGYGATTARRYLPYSGTGPTNRRASSLWKPIACGRPSRGTASLQRIGQSARRRIAPS